MKTKPKKEKRVVTSFMINVSTREFLKNGIPNIKNGHCIDELVRIYKESRKI
jgi:hypothetical protein